MKYLLSFILVLCVQNSSAIVNGQLLHDGSFKQSVALVYRKSPVELYGEVYCSATLIGPRLVITAAHCLKSGAVAFNLPLEDFIKNTWIYFGEPALVDIPLAIPQFSVEKALIYPVSNAMFSDVALLVLKGSIPAERIGEPLAKIALADHTMLGKDLIHVGFGKTDNNGPKGAKSIMSLPIQHINLYNGMGVGFPRTEGPSACNGDSGGSAYTFTDNGELKFIGIEQSISNHPCGKSATYFIPIIEQILNWVKASGYPIF